jgi:hypothetical protein
MERREHRFTKDRGGHILDGTPEPAVEELPDEEWRPLGEIDPATGRSTVDYSLANRWRPHRGVLAMALRGNPSCVIQGALRHPFLTA